MTDQAHRDADFRQFAGGLGDALSRLAALLVDDDDVARELVVRSLAQLRSRWASLASAGAPEAQAVDALVSRLPRSVSVVPKAVSVVDGATGAAGTAGADGVDGAEDDEEWRRRQTVLRSWARLTPRQRASLLFVDASVASPRLAGLSMPPSLGSAARVEALAGIAWTTLSAAVHADPWAAGWSFDDDDLGAALAEALRGKAAALPSFALATAQIARQRRADLNKMLLSATGVVVVLVVIAAVVVHVSMSKSAGATAKTSAVSLGSAIAPPQFTIVTPPTAAPRPASSPPPLSAVGASVDDTGLVVDWPIRGSLAGNIGLASDVRTSFTAAHADLTGPVQVLLMTDTTTFRVAYVTARTATGSIGSWFYGNIGDQHLKEGSSSLGFSIVGPDGVVSAVLVYAGSRELVAVASPTAASMVLHGGPEPVGFLAHQGFGVLDITQFAENGLQIDVTSADGSSSTSLPQEVDLDRTTPQGGGISTAGYPIVRGYPDPGLLIDADQVATIWQTSDLHNVGVPDVLWGGSDGTIQQVVVRLRTAGGIDVVVVAWGGPEAKADAELLAPHAADFPLTWDYPDGTGTRVGVLVPIGVTSVRLVVDGAPASAPVPVDANGYASIVEPPYSGTLTGHTVAVAMSDSQGKPVASLSVPPPA